MHQVLDLRPARSAGELREEVVPLLLAPLLPWDTRRMDGGLTLGDCATGSVTRRNAWRFMPAGRGAKLVLESCDRAWLLLEGVA